MRGRLGVRVSDGTVDRFVTARTRDLRFRKTAPGGHHSASMTLVLPRNTFRDLGPADKVYVYDAQTARTVWEGYAENPGATDGPGGQSFDLSAIGGMSLASDESEKLIYLDTAFDSWRRDDTIAQAASASTDVGAFPDTGNSALMCQFNPGQPVSTSSQARMIYDAFADATTMSLGAFSMTSKGGANDVDYKMEWVVPGTTIAARDLTTTGAATTKYVTTDFPDELPTLAVRLRRSGGATNVATDNVWAGFGSVKILGHRVGREGYKITMPPAVDYVLASDVVLDLLGRLLNTCDQYGSTIETTTALIDQLAYHDGATAAQVLEDLQLFEPDYLWEILESSGQWQYHRFNYRKWPTTPRYEISVKDGYNAPGGEVDLCNRIAVYWNDAKGNKRTTVVTQTVEALGARTRDAEPITLPDGVGSAANATRIGQQVLATKANPPKAATATVRRPILDRDRGCMVMPWEIEPGYVVRVRETGDDLRLQEMEYVDADCAATLTLGEPVRTQEQMIAALSRRRR